jgi:hypothetical protein
MSSLYLHCGLCGRKQADGLLSRGYWGHLEVATGSTLRACPSCKQSNDWEARLLASLESAGPSLDRTAWGFGSR